MLNFSEAMSDTYVQGGERKHLNVALGEVCLFIPELFPGGRCVPEVAGVTVSPPPFLSDAPSLFSQL